MSRDLIILSKSCYPSKLGKCGLRLAVGEYDENVRDLKQYSELEKFEDWRKVFSDDYQASFVLSDLEWESTEDYFDVIKKKVLAVLGDREDADDIDIKDMPLESNNKLSSLVDIHLKLALFAKFSQNDKLKQILLATGDAELCYVSVDYETQKTDLKPWKSLMTVRKCIRLFNNKFDLSLASQATEKMIEQIIKNEFKSQSNKKESKMNERETLIQKGIPVMLPDIVGIIDKYISGPFTIVVKANNKLVIPKIETDGMLLDWGDEKREVINTVVNQYEHEYKTPGEYTIKMDGKITGISLRGMDELVQIAGWGEADIDRGAFQGCNNLNSVTAIDDYPDNHRRLFKILLVGSAGSGKTELLHSILGDTFERRYIPTMGVENTILCFNTSVGHIILKISDVAGQELFGNSIDNNYNDSDGAIVMTDVGYNSSIEGVRFFRRKLRTLSKINNRRIPKILVANKIDITPRDRKVDDTQITELGERGFDRSVSISVKRGINTEEPFLELIRLLLNDDTVVLVPQENLMITNNNDS